MSENEKLIATSEDTSVASLMLISSLISQLVADNLLTGDKANYIAACAASMCRGQNMENSAALIENVIPTAVGVNITVEAMKQGFWINKEPR